MHIIGAPQHIASTKVIAKFSQGDGKTKNLQGEFVYAHLYESFLELLIIKDNKLLFYNFFEYKTAEDFVYFILFSCEQLKLDVEKLMLLFSGNILKKDKIYQLIYTYIRNIDFLDSPDAFGYTASVSEVQAHVYSKFFYHFTCE